MSRSEKRRRREQRESRRQTAGSYRQFKRRQSGLLFEAQDLIGRGRLPEARHILEEQARAQPSASDCWRLLLEVYHGQRDYTAYCSACQRLMELDPGDHELHLAMASACLGSMRPASAVIEYRRFLELCPGHLLADEARKNLAKLEPVLDEMLRDTPFPQEIRYDLAALHERVLADLGRGEYDQAIRRAEELSARCPEYIPAMNNLAQLYFQTDRVADAMLMSRKVLERAPDNLHAVADLAKFLLLSGRPQEAAAWHQRLREIHSEHPEIWPKKVELFAYFGDDAAVLDAFEGARRAGLLKPGYPGVARLYRFAGVAAARLGNEALARQHLRAALRENAGGRTARCNLDDLDQPVSERNGPWPFRLDYWVRPRFMERIQQTFLKRPAGATPVSHAKILREFVAEFPELLALVPHLLDRGDELGRRLAWQIAFELETPELVDALRAFCLSQRGPDSLRVETANRLYERDRVESPLRMWINGRWREVEAVGFAITDEPTCGPCADPQAQKWAEAAYAALQRGDGATAERLLKNCLARQGDEPDLLNNLANAYNLQGRREEHLRLAHEIHERWPDYFFGRIGMANLATAAGRYEQAAAYLRPLGRRRKLHTTEFAALCSAHIDMLCGWDKREAARVWFDLWKSAQPDHPAIPERERLLGFAATTHTLR